MTVCEHLWSHPRNAHHWGGENVDWKTGPKETWNIFCNAHCGIGSGCWVTLGNTTRPIHEKTVVVLDHKSSAKCQTKSRRLCPTGDRTVGVKPGLVTGNMTATVPEHGRSCWFCGRFPGTVKCGNPSRVLSSQVPKQEGRAAGWWHLDSCSPVHVPRGQITPSFCNLGYYQHCPKN